MPNKVEKLPDGNFNVELETGEKFSGDALEVTQKMADAHVSTKRWGQEWKQKAESQPQPLPPGTTPAAQPIDPNEKATQDWLARNTFAGAGLGTPDEVKKEWEQIKAFKEQVELNNAASTFYQMHPECPGDQKAIDAISSIFNEHPEWTVTSGNLEAAHLIALQRNLYQRIDPNAQNETRPAAPPMLRGGNPEITSGNPDPYAMPMDQLRAQAIKQQLGGK